MQAPQAPIDIKITLGSEVGIQNLVNLDIDLSDDKEVVKNFLAQKKITEDYGKDLVLMFDFNVEAGRQKQAMNYFGSQQSTEQGKSPLQILFNIRPSQSSDFCKLSFEQHQGFIRMLYKFTLQQDIQKFLQILQIFQSNNFQFETHANFDIKGTVSHNKKNRTNVKVDYAKFHLTSNAFCTQFLMNSLFAIEQIQNDLQQLINNPFVELLKKSKMAKINIKLDSFRKINRFYNQVSQSNKQTQTKQFKYLNKGIFRQKAQASLVFNNQYLVRVNGIYQSQDVFIRLLKVYAKFFQKMLEKSFYHDD